MSILWGNEISKGKGGALFKNEEGLFKAIRESGLLTCFQMQTKILFVHSLVQHVLRDENLTINALTFHPQSSHI